MANPFKPTKKAGSLSYFGILIIPFVVFLLGLTVGYNQAKQDTARGAFPNGNSNTVLVTPLNVNSNFSKQVDMSLFWDVWNLLGNTYVDTSKLNEEDMVYGAVKGMVMSLKDPYTLFMTPKETEEFRNSLSGDLQGIGAELSIKDNHLIIVSPLKDSPAEKAGLKPGDIIYKINDSLTANITLSEAVAKIRGEKGTKVKLVILRNNEDKPIELEIERQEIKVPSISWEIKADNLAYISLNQFGDDTTKEFSNAINELLLKKPKGLVLDLRFNGGGYLDGAVDIVSEFVGGNKVVTVVKRRLSKDDEVQRVNGHPRLEHMPLVVLINAGSASAAEIVAGALKDYKRATLIGEKTFGKGTVQELQPLSDGSSLRVTIAQWLTPSNANIDGVGILPDKEVKNSEEDDQQDIDRQLEEALAYLSEQLR